jgi:hypothetical protein
MQSATDTSSTHNASQQDVTSSTSAAILNNLNIPTTSSYTPMCDLLTNGALPPSMENSENYLEKLKSHHLKLAQALMGASLGETGSDMSKHGSGQDSVNSEQGKFGREALFEHLIGKKDVCSTTESEGFSSSESGQCITI